MSVGGGTQGLAESQTFNGPDPGVADLQMEKNFGGSFIGGISKLRFHIVALDTVQIRHNFEMQRSQYGMALHLMKMFAVVPILTENEDILLTEDDKGSIAWCNE